MAQQISLLHSATPAISQNGRMDKNGETGYAPNPQKILRICANLVGRPGRRWVVLTPGPPHSAAPSSLCNSPQFYMV